MFTQRRAHLRHTLTGVAWDEYFKSRTGIVNPTEQNLLQYIKERQFDTSSYRRETFTMNDGQQIIQVQAQLDGTTYWGEGCSEFRAFMALILNWLDDQAERIAICG